ncbi:glycoside hydrolase family 2 protein [Granulicella rosea]|uniref:glycoside hydrolase family 2 protein n=1 Tax=Granulicella rosea TaxID=474952 RepID=UPI00159507BC|nr:glycoside hydrolase family 2 TIM barrel-domain containing protein [Granulicella rosea]
MATIVAFVTPFAQVTYAQTQTPPPQVGPYLAHILPGGPALSKQMPVDIVQPKGWTEWAWVQLEPLAPLQTATIAGIGKPANGFVAPLLLTAGHAAVRATSGKICEDPSVLTPSAWHLIASVYHDEKLDLLVDGEPACSMSMEFGQDSNELTLGPTPVSVQETRFDGKIAFGAIAGALGTDEIRTLYRHGPQLGAGVFEENAKSWHLQTKQQLGYIAPQPPEMMPHGSLHLAPVERPVPIAKSSLLAEPDGSWQIAANWKLLYDVAVPANSLSGLVVSKPGFDDRTWLRATEPGTVLTTLVDRGIFPDPTFGLNNLSIPESLNKQQYWYRVEFESPSRSTARRQLVFAGINYEAEIWLNGQRLGSIRGAFNRGVFDVSGKLKAGHNALAVLVSPPPHPGIPQEASLLAGPGENGGIMAIDGPTFICSEGWDWLPAIRDRETGIWQPVILRNSGEIQLGDPQVTTTLPLPDISTADVSIRVPARNIADTTQNVSLVAEFEGVSLRLPISIKPGTKEIVLDKERFPQLHLLHPRLWWPNGYGSPDLYHLKLHIESAGIVEDSRTVTFGIREVSYELSLFDAAGRLDRVEALPQRTMAKKFNPVLVNHEALRQTEGGWAATIDPRAEATDSILPVKNEPGMTDLVIKVNGVRIAARGGNWGLDDAMKRVTRDRLEPYFRLHREANLNIIRNWVGQNTEEVFYQLADEYGLMVWNDFWESTQNYNAEADDTKLFLDNARDTVQRFRNHPSIVLWCGRNEGVPQPVLNRGLIDIFAQEDGARLYLPSSIAINLRPSGPYSWTDPQLYFTRSNRGFSVELGISSFPTREAFMSSMPTADQWPISDNWAYHDWHQQAGGDTHELMKEMERQFGPSTSLNEFERRIQMFNLVDHQAIFEGFYQHLWRPNSGRMIWMTHPSWPSVMWQMYSSDYDTQASFYAIRRANAPLHVQMDPSDGTIAIVNTTRTEENGLHVLAAAYSLSNQRLAQLSKVLHADSDATTEAGQLDLPAIFKNADVALIRLELRDANEALLADNFYWLGPKSASYRKLLDLPENTLAVQTRELAAETHETAKERVITVTLSNHQSTAALAIKATLERGDGSRVLPAYYSDNYVSLLPGESRTVSIHFSNVPPDSTGLKIGVRGWNVRESTVAVTSTVQLNSKAGAR